MTATRPWKVPIGFVLTLCTAFLLAASTAFAVATADIQITKSNDTGGTLVAGGTVHYTITATNLGPNGASQVVVEDDLDSHISSVSGLAVTQPSQCVQAGTPIVITCNMQGLGASGSINTINFDAVVDPSTPKGTIIQNCPFEVSSNSTDPDHTNDSSPFSCDGAGFTVVINHDLSVEKTRTSPDPGTVTTIPGGTDVTYHIVVTNNGPSPIAQADMSVTDTLSGTVGGTFVGITNLTGNLDCSTASAFPFTCTATADWASGDSASFDLTLTLDNTAGTITNTATVPTTDDLDTTNNTSSVTDDVCLSVDLTLTKTCRTFCPPVTSPTKNAPIICEPTTIVDPIQGGTEFTYHIVITNTDSSIDATNVVFDDPLPAGVSLQSVTGDQCTTGTIAANTCVFDVIGAGLSKTFDINVIAVESGVINNSASATADQCDRTPADNTDQSCSVTVETNNMPTALEVDREGCLNLTSPFCTGDPDSVATDSNVNRVFDGPGPNEVNELVRVDPTWENTLNNDVAVTGTIDTFTGPGDGGPHVTYAISDNTADYGTIPGHTAADCNSATGDCYELSLVLDDPANRPIQHWDTTVHEALSTGETKTWTLHIGGSFPDVLLSNIFYRQIETIFHNHITLGCFTGFCPTNDTRRDEMAAFIARSIEGTDALVPTSGSGYDCTNGGSSNFTDIDPTSVFCRHTNFLFVNGISSGCGGGDFCPAGFVLRGDAAIFVARGMNVKNSLPAEPVPDFGTDGGTRSYNCSTTTTQGGIPPNTPPFPDVAAGGEPCPAIGFLWVNHIVNGDQNGNFRPGDFIRRDEMATVLSTAFVSLPLYGPLNP